MGFIITALPFCFLNLLLRKLHPTDAISYSMKRLTFFALCFAFLSGLALFACPAAASEPLRYIYDDADLLTDAEIRELGDIAQEYFDELRVHFAILTLDDADVTDLESYTRNFHDTNISGVDGVYECAVMTINMGTRRVAVDFFGELRTMISDSEASVIREGFTPSMTDGDYHWAALCFLDESAALIEKKLALYNVETPLVDTELLVYDFDGLLSSDETEKLRRSARELSENTGIGHIIVILEDSQEEEYLKYYASSFYKQNFQDSGLFDGAFILAVSAEGQTVSLSPFGSYAPKNYLLWYLESDLDDRLYNSLYDACGYFLYYQADSWQSENLEMPPIDPSLKIYDFADFLTNDQENNLRSIINERREKYGVDFMIILSDLSTPKTLDSFQFEFSNAVWDYQWGNTECNFITLVIGSPLEYNAQFTEIDIFGTKVYRKIGWKQHVSLRSNVYGEVLNSDYYSACLTFLDDASKALSSPIPNVRMIDDAGGALVLSVAAGLVLSGLILLIMRIAHGFGMKREVSAENYLVDESFQLHYARDIFLHSHTSKSRKSSESSSGGGSGGGSSGGGTSSRSEGSF